MREQPLLVNEYNNTLISGGGLQVDIGCEGRHGRDQRTMCFGEVGDLVLDIHWDIHLDRTRAKRTDEVGSGIGSSRLAEVGTGKVMTTNH